MLFVNVTVGRGCHKVWEIEDRSNKVVDGILSTESGRTIIKSGRWEITRIKLGDWRSNTKRRRKVQNKVGVG